MNPLVITGVGAVAHQVVGRAAFAKALAERPIAHCAPPTLFEPAKWPGSVVCEANDFDPTPILGDKGLRNIDRLTKFFLVSARQALEDAGLRKDAQWLHGEGRRAGVCASTAYGSLESMVELHRVALLESPRYLNPAKFPNTVINAALGYVSIWEDLRALNATVCNGNCGALDSVLVAETFLASERADVIVVGGAEAMHEGLFLAFARLEALAGQQELWQPGDSKNSRGMRLGEGSVMLVLEREQSARDRGASSDVRIIGFGTSFEPPPNEVTLVHLSAGAIAQAISLALDDANVDAGDIDAVISSANGYGAYDRAEHAALAEVFERELPRAYCKHTFGETLGAGGAFALASAHAVLSGVTPAARSATSWPSAIKRVLLTSVGFYGNASAVVVERSS
jgi:3-oxoacyl-(acyl-carrier-protein) synthase